MFATNFSYAYKHNSAPEKFAALKYCIAQFHWYSALIGSVLCIRCWQHNLEQTRSQDYLVISDCC